MCPRAGSTIALIRRCSARVRTWSQPGRDRCGRGQQAVVLDPAVTDEAALEESVAKARESRGEDGGPCTVHEIPKPKRSAKKAPAKKTA